MDWNTRRFTGGILIGLLAFATLGCPPEDPDDAISYQAELAGENQTPAVATPATGQVDVTLENNTLEIDGDFDGLVSNLRDVAGAPIHVYEITADDDDNIVVSADIDADDDDRSGTFTVTHELTEQQENSFRTGDLYLNIHTNAYPDGELAAPLDEAAPEYASLDESWGVELSAAQQPHAVDTTAEGWMWVILRNDDTMVASGAFQNLTSPLLDVDGGPINIHRGEFGETGESVFNLDYDTATDDEDTGRFWYRTSLTSEEVDELTDGDYYLNIFTEDFPDGELRGQIGEEPDGFFQETWEDIFGDEPEDIDEAPPF